MTTLLSPFRPDLICSSIYNRIIYYQQEKNLDSMLIVNEQNSVDYLSSFEFYKEITEPLILDGIESDLDKDKIIGNFKNYWTKKLKNKSTCFYFEENPKKMSNFLHFLKKYYIAISKKMPSNILEESNDNLILYIKNRLRFLVKIYIKRYKFKDLNKYFLSPQETPDNSDIVNAITEYLLASYIYTNNREIINQYKLLNTLPKNQCKQYDKKYIKNFNNILYFFPFLEQTITHNSQNATYNELTIDQAYNLTPKIVDNLSGLKINYKNTNFNSFSKNILLNLYSSASKNSFPYSCYYMSHKYSNGKEKISFLKNASDYKQIINNKGMDKINDQPIFLSLEIEPISTFSNSGSILEKYSAYHSPVDYIEGKNHLSMDTFIAFFKHITTNINFPSENSLDNYYNQTLIELIANPLLLMKFIDADMLEDNLEKFISQNKDTLKTFVRLLSMLPLPKFRTNLAGHLSEWHCTSSDFFNTINSVNILLFNLTFIFLPLLDEFFKAIFYVLDEQDASSHCTNITNKKSNGVLKSALTEKLESCLLEFAKIPLFSETKKYYLDYLNKKIGPYHFNNINYTHEDMQRFFTVFEDQNLILPMFDAYLFFAYKPIRDDYKIIKQPFPYFFGKA